MQTPRPEYPRPQFVRASWMCLNGSWEFEIDPADTGRERGLMERPLRREIQVPFCPESTLSGIGEVDFMEAVWYRRTLRFPESWRGQAVLLHFQAVDYDATVWVNGTELARHRGGHTPFCARLEPTLIPEGEATIVVRARDTRHGQQPRGKQSQRYKNDGCHYTRTTGIWQTVWAEPVGACHLQRPRITPLVEAGGFLLEQAVFGRPAGARVEARLLSGGHEVARAEAHADLALTPTLWLAIPPAARRLWSPEDPHLYDLELTLRGADGTVLDTARSYAGLRSVALVGTSFLLNGKPIFQRLILDQGYYPDGIMTAPSDQALVRDIELAQAAGFNGARLHQKIFEERFLWHADRLGYLVWGEFADWGLSVGCPEDNVRPTLGCVSEWIEAVQRDYSHPCIIGWCPMNECGQPLLDRISELDAGMRALFLATKLGDATRPVLDSSGWSHRVAERDVCDTHDYEQDPAKLRANHAGTASGQPHRAMGHHDPRREMSLPYGGQPFFVSEFGGIWWNPQAREDEISWGYGDRPRSAAEFLERFADLCCALRQTPGLFGYCYTQLTDVFQEQNGLYHFDRSPKFDPAELRRRQAEGYFSPMR